MRTSSSLGTLALLLVIATPLACGSSESTPQSSPDKDGGSDGAALGPRIHVSTQSIAAGNLACCMYPDGSSNGPLPLPSFDVENTGDQPLTVDVTASSGIVNYDLPWKLTLDPGSKQTLTPGFEPGACCGGEDLKKTITFASNDPTNPQVNVDISGKGVIHAVTVDPVQLEWTAADFASSSNVDKQLSFTNPGPLPVPLIHLFDTLPAPFTFATYPGDLKFGDEIPVGGSGVIHLLLNDASLQASPFDATVTFEDPLASTCGHGHAVTVTLKVSATSG